MLSVLTAPEFGTNYELWLRISCAVYDASDGQDWAFTVWDQWCQRLPGYDADENAYKWPTFATERPDKATVGTLIDEAKANGYELPPDAHDAIEEAHRASIKMFQDYAAPEAPKEQAGPGRERTGSQARRSRRRRPRPRSSARIGEIVEALAWQTEADPWGIYASLLVMYGELARPPGLRPGRRRPPLRHPVRPARRPERHRAQGHRRRHRRHDHE